MTVQHIVTTRNTRVEFMRQRENLGGKNYFCQEGFSTEKKPVFPLFCKKIANPDHSTFNTKVELK